MGIERGRVNRSPDDPEAEEKRRDFKRRIDRTRAESAQRQNEFKQEVTPRLRPAKTEDYAEWISEFMRRGGTPTHFYEYPYEKAADTFFVASGDFRMFPLYGAEAVHIIVPQGVQFLGGDLGHSSLYFADGRVLGTEWIPVFNNTISD